MKLSQFDFPIPEELIAQFPLEDRAASRMMLVDRKTGEIRHENFREISSFVKPNDLFVFNQSKVIPARFFGKRDSGGKVEVFLLRSLGGSHYECMIRATAGKKEGLTFSLSEKIKAKVLRQLPQSMTFEVSFTASEEEMAAFMQAHGRIPLPPYIQRDPVNSDLERYQTVYAKTAGSVAAPTAGLHFTPAILEAMKAMGAEIDFVTLHVGLGTFQPIKVENISEHKMHSEEFFISDELKAKCAQKNGRRLVAVGTTSMRTLESVARSKEGSTDIYITPGFEFRWVDSLVTNFHQPKSSLIVLLSAFLGSQELLSEVYKKAVEEKYRFFSYGDCMLVL